MSKIIRKGPLPEVPEIYTCKECQSDISFFSYEIKQKGFFFLTFGTAYADCPVCNKECKFTRLDACSY